MRGDVMEASRRNARWIAVVLAASLVAVAGLSLTACSAPQNELTTNAKDVSVTIKDLRFNPPKLIVEPGTTVTWTNDDNTVHTVSSDATSGPTSFKASEFLDPGKSFSHKFEQPGDYKYHCDVHPYLMGEVIVRNK